MNDIYLKLCVVSVILWVGAYFLSYKLESWEFLTTLGLFIIVEFLLMCHRGLTIWNLKR